MVKKNYLAPKSSEARTKLRTGLLAGSNVTVGTGETKTDGSAFKNARVRGTEAEAKAVSSID